jgi:hypothetical protein
MRISKKSCMKNCVYDNNYTVHIAYF